MNAIILEKLMKWFILFLLAMALFGCATDSPTGQDHSGNSTNIIINENNTSEVESDTKPARTNYVNVKYRDTTVDIAAPYFEYLDTTGSSFIRGTWYDQGNKYMVINLDGEFYHYCGMPSSVWSNFKRAESFGRFYQQNIKDKYDCRQGYVPGY